MKDFLNNWTPLSSFLSEGEVVSIEDLSGLEKNYMFLLLEGFFHR